MKTKVKKINNLIVEEMIGYKILNKDEKEIYDYGLDLLELKLLHMIVLLLIGFFTNSFSNTIVFLLLFQWLRKYSGGYHSSKSSYCLLLSIIFEIGMLFFVSYFNINNLFQISFTFILSIGIIMNAPIASKNNPLNSKEIELYRYEVKKIVATLNILFISSLILSLNNISKIIMYVLFVCMITLIAGRKTVLTENKMKRKVKVKLYSSRDSS